MVTGRVDEIKVLFAYTHKITHACRTSKRELIAVRCRGRRALAEITNVHRARYTVGSGDRFDGVVVPTAATTGTHHAFEFQYRYRYGRLPLASFASPTSGRQPEGLSLA